MINDVDQWLSDASSNFGWILLGQETTLRSARRFDSGEHATAANRPLLTIDFNEPVANAPIVVATFVDEVDSSGGAGDTGISLREAISTANTNGNGQVDEIILPAGTYTLDRTGTAEDLNSLGDLDLNSPMIIRGAGQGQTIINAGGTGGLGWRYPEHGRYDDNHR